MTPRARAVRSGEENAERGEPETAVSLLHSFPPAEDADAVLPVLSEVAGYERWVRC